MPYCWPRPFSNGLVRKQFSSLHTKQGYDLSEKIIEKCKWELIKLLKRTEYYEKIKFWRNSSAVCKINGLYTNGSNWTVVKWAILMLKLCVNNLCRLNSISKQKYKNQTISCSIHQIKFGLEKKITIIILIQSFSLNVFSPNLLPIEMIFLATNSNR